MGGNLYNTAKHMFIISCGVVARCGYAHACELLQAPTMHAVTDELCDTVTRHDLQSIASNRNDAGPPV